MPTMIHSIPNNQSFKCVGPVIIEGDVGDNAIIEVLKGGVIIKGNVGNNVRIRTREYDETIYQKLLETMANIVAVFPTNDTGNRPQFINVAALSIQAGIDKIPLAPASCGIIIEGSCGDGLYLDTRQSIVVKDTVGLNATMIGYNIALLTADEGLICNAQGSVACRSLGDKSTLNVEGSLYAFAIGNECALRIKEHLLPLSGLLPKDVTIGNRCKIAAHSMKIGNTGSESYLEAEESILATIIQNNTRVVAPIVECAILKQYAAVDAMQRVKADLMEKESRVNSPSIYCGPSTPWVKRVASNLTENDYGLFF